MLKLHNTLSRKKEEFRPRDKKKINLFVCGPTVYDFAHIGHARTYVIFDVIVKYLKQAGYKVFYLQNITDIDDKIINRAKERGVTPKDLAEQFEKAYFEDMKDLGIDSISKYARATKHIKEIISQVERLFKKGFAYQLEDGIYYDISKFKDYGKLAKRTVLQAEDGVSRIDEGTGKRNKGDFCLWKLAPKESLRPPTGQAKPFVEPSWPSPWGKGRPGWHIEDTAISEKYFGPQYDIHGGARDLIFPHHEAEIAQIEAISGKSPFVKYWLHSGFLTVKGQKMAKSLGNFITIRDFLKENSPRLLKLLIVKSYYRSPLDYNEDLVLQTKKELDRIDEFVVKLMDLRNQSKLMDLRNQSIDISGFEKKFKGAMEDDFNTPKAMAVLFDLVNKGNSLLAQDKLSQKESKEILEFFREVDKVFNFIFWRKPKERVPSELLSLAKQREKYRKQGNWQKADETRKKIEEMGYAVEDTKEGPKIKKL